MKLHYIHEKLEKWEKKIYAFKLDYGLETQKMKTNKPLKNIVEYVNNIKQPVFDKIAIWIGIVSGLLSILQYFGLPLWMQLGLVKKLMNFIDLHSKGILVVTIILWLLFALVIIIKYRSSAIMRMNVSSINLAELISDSKDTLADLNGIQSKNINLNCMQDDEGVCDELKESKMEIGKSNRRALNLIFLHYTTSFLDKIKVILESYVGREVSTCFKMYVEYPDENTTEFIRGTVTLARDRESDKNRVFCDAKEVIPLERNSDFQEIINGKHLNPYKTYFYQSDLKRYSKELERVTDGRYRYENSNVDWPKHYVGTIVVPVKNLVITENGKKNEVRGFLCVDSMSKGAFTEKQKVINIRLMQSFADIYSLVLRAYDSKMKENSIDN